jgi:hypothetical protein
LSRIDARLTSIEERLGPPGLNAGLEVVFEKLEAMSSEIQKVRESANFGHRLERLETLTVCSPSSDAVLEAMFEQRRAEQPVPKTSPLEIMEAPPKDTRYEDEENKDEESIDEGKTNLEGSISDIEGKDMCQSYQSTQSCLDYFYVGEGVHMETQTPGSPHHWVAEQHAVGTQTSNATYTDSEGTIKNEKSVTNEKCSEEGVNNENERSSEESGKNEKSSKESDSSEKSSEESENETNSKVIVKSGKSSEESVANEKSSKEKSGCSTAKKQWRCYHCWSNLESERVICRYCKDKTVAKMFEPT